MGAMGGEEHLSWEKMQMSVADHEEKILVLVRLRPLSEKEITRDEVSDWECINDTTILFRNSLQERSAFPTTHTFDRVFWGDCSTKQVYEEGTKEIATSAVGGINSTIFAYGQTSSGKTYTMTGITEYTVADIYDYIHRHEERAFVLKFSAMEIYNEAVRDLLSSDSSPLRILDDPEKGTIVEKLTEEILRDWGHLKDLLTICEAQRQTGETSLNETSSRSHQILRLTIESSAREFLGKGKSSTLSASVNFVDLAGSERASQALSAGSRLKEGCHINRSLLTLGTVIRKLSREKHGHVNYRDSKLTRILQPSLGGNARTAIICTLSPARSHVEQSRNTLLFACCAKQVTTNAQVNVVMSDKALVKHLQKELARLENELRSPPPSSSNCDYGALLRRKDLLIDKLTKENRDLINQRDLAQSRVEDLLQVIGNDQALRKWAGDKDECSASSGVDNGNHVDIGNRKFHKTHYQDHPDGSEASISDETPQEDRNGLYKDVQCIEMEKSNGNHNLNLYISSADENGPTSTSHNDDITYQTEGREINQLQSDVTYNFIHQKVQVVRKMTDSLTSPYSNEPSPWALSRQMTNCKKLTRSRSYDERRINGTSSPCPELHNVKSSLSSLERSFPLKNDANFGALLGNDFRDSAESSFLDRLKELSEENSIFEDVTSVHTFVARLKEMAGGLQVNSAAPEAVRSGKNLKDVGLDPMQEEALGDWPLEFEKQQKAIIELWQICNVSLVHRTYFFLIFTGEPSDAVYMEVEFRRLSFLKEQFYGGNLGLPPTLTSSIRRLRCERDTLTRMMQKRFSEAERVKLYEKWGIRLNSKRRRLQLAQCLWSNTEDLKHMMESALIIAKLVKFTEQGKALKEVFGLSFSAPTPPFRRGPLGGSGGNILLKLLS